MNKSNPFLSLFPMIFDRQIKSLKSILKLGPDKLCIRLGASYFGFGILALASSSLQAAAMPNNRSDKMFELFGLMQGIWRQHMPTLALLGILYMAFGLTISKWRFANSQTFIALAIASLVWPLFYMFDSLEFISSFSNLMPNMLFKAYSYTVGAIGYLFVILLFIVPQAYIYKSLRSATKQNSAQ